MSSGVSAVGLAEMNAALLAFDVDLDDVARVDALRELERMRGAVAAVQARLAVAFDLSQRAAQVAAGVRAGRVGRGVPAQVGLARRVSPNEAARYLGQVRILTSELPECFARLHVGEVSEWRVLLVARETAWLSPEHRAGLDAEIAPQLPALGSQKIIGLAQRIAYRLDPHGLVGRKERAEKERHVGIRPVPECMARLSGLLPMP